MTTLQERLRGNHHTWRDTIERCAEAADRIDALESQVAALTADAERYRALRRGQKWSVIDGIGNTLRAEDLDAAIAAQKGTV